MIHLWTWLLSNVPTILDCACTEFRIPNSQMCNSEFHYVDVVLYTTTTPPLYCCVRMRAKRGYVQRRKAAECEGHRHYIKIRQPHHFIGLIKRALLHLGTDLHIRSSSLIWRGAYVCRCVHLCIVHGKNEEPFALPVHS